MSESKLLVENKNIVVPGEKIATGMEFLPSYGTYRQNNDILANMVSLVNIDGKVIKLVPLSGTYFPKKGDTIIGEVQDVTMNGWRLKINCAYEAFMSTANATSKFIQRGENLTRYFDIGDFVVTKIISVTSQNLVDLTAKGPGLQKLHDGRLVKVNSQKVPRIIGKQGSMVTLVKNATECKITVGQNGYVWVSGKPEGEILAIKTLKMIEENAHTSGLTDKIKSFLEQNGGKKAQAQPVTEAQPQPQQSNEQKPEGESQ